MLLGLSGFISPVESIVDGATTMISQTQSEAVLFTIKGILGLSSVILLVPAIIIAVRWQLTKEKHAALISYLDHKRAGQVATPEEEAEIQEILKPLI